MRNQANGAPNTRTARLLGEANPRQRWDRINGDGSFQANPWVVAVSFKRVDPNDGN